MTDNPIVHVIDDDNQMRTSLDDLLRSMDYETALYKTAQQFLDTELPDRPGCILLDVRLPGLSGMELQEHLNRLEIRLPIILMTGFGDIQMSVRAMKAGAVDFLTKPFRDQDMLDAVTHAIASDRVRRQCDSEMRSIRDAYTSLSPRERQVMDLVVSGRLNKQIANDLSLSEVTVKVHRAGAMRKMAANSVAELSRMAELLRSAG